MNIKENISFAYWEYTMSSVDNSKLIMLMFFFMVLLLLIYILLSVKENS